MTIILKKCKKIDLCYNVLRIIYSIYLCYCSCADILLLTDYII